MYKVMTFIVVLHQKAYLMNNIFLKTFLKSAFLDLEEMFLKWDLNRWLLHHMVFYTGNGSIITIQYCIYTINVSFAKLIIFNFVSESKKCRFMSTIIHEAACGADVLDCITVYIVYCKILIA